MLAPAACGSQCLYSVQALRPSALANGGERLCVQSGWVVPKMRASSTLSHSHLYRGVEGSIIRAVMESVPVSSGSGTLRWSQRSFALAASFKQGSLELFGACQSHLLMALPQSIPAVPKAGMELGCRALHGLESSARVQQLQSLLCSPCCCSVAVLYPCHEQPQWDTSEIPSAHPVPPGLAAPIP